MISEDFIKTLAKKYQTSELNVRREYFQHLFLSYFYQQSKAKNIFFKGGTALRLIYNSPRFSEDLDFNSTSINYKELEVLLLDTLSQVEKENIPFNLKEAKKTTGGFLAVIGFGTDKQPVDIQIEISLRKEEKKGEAIAISSDFVPPYNIISVTEKQLVFEKLRALLSRKKARDFYDLYFIIRSRLTLPHKKDLFQESLKTLKNSNINFEKELKLFLPKSHWAIIRNFKQTLEKEIQKFI
jgi:predicted nucleotidyltransferase component of viral defense system